MLQANNSNQTQDQDEQFQKQVNGPDPIVNEDNQSDVINPGNNDYDEADEAKKEEGYDEGNKDDSNTEKEPQEGDDYDDGLPGEDDDSGKTIRETPKM